jgi:mannosyl-oligosaccharide alpha-1,2-mannosidase
MFRFTRRQLWASVFAFSILFLYTTLPHKGQTHQAFDNLHKGLKSSRWSQRQQKYPVPIEHILPREKPLRLPKIQHDFEKEGRAERSLRLSRLQAVRDSFAYTWRGYRQHAWLKDELKPLTGGSRDSFGNWSATLVDSLDTLWIMGFEDEFEEAVAAIGEIDFETSTSKIISVFETTIRYLGGLISAYDLSGRPLLLEKALELGNMLYAAFDTPNRMPVPYWNWKQYVF